MNLSVLALLEDDILIRTVFEILKEDHCIAIVEHENEALAKYRQYEFDLVVVSKTPSIDSVGLIGAIRKYNPAQNILVVGDEFNRDAHIYLGFGAQLLFRSDNLLEQVRGVLSRVAASLPQAHHP
jgi:two-component SAPR family response regulator